MFKKFFTKTNKNSKKGFTLVEIMVSVTIFSLVMIMVATLLLSIVSANVKAQTLKSTLDNLNVAIENMSRSIRVGTDYCDPVACSQTGANSFSFNSTIDGNKTVVYGYDGHHITRSVGNGLPVELTGEDVDITSLEFFTFNTNSSEEPYVIMTVKGNPVASGHGPVEPFNLEITISARQ